MNKSSKVIFNSAPPYTGVGIMSRMLFEAWGALRPSVSFMQIPALRLKNLVMKTHYEGIAVSGDTSLSLALKPFPNVVVIHHPMYLMKPENYPRTHVLAFKHALRVIAEKQAKIIMFSNWGRKNLLELNRRLDPDNIKVIHPYSLLPEPNADDLRNVRERFSYAFDETLEARATVLAVGTSMPHKNFVTLYRATKNQKLNVVRIGANEELERREYDQLASHVSYIHEKLTDLEMSCIYRLSDLLVFTGTEEGFGRPLIEAMSLGIPVVGNYQTTVPEILGEGMPKVKNPYDHVALLDAIKEVIANHDGYRKKAISQSAIYSKEHCVSDLRELDQTLSEY